MLQEVRPFQCGYCSHYTKSRGNCNQHIRKHHKDMPVLVIDHLASMRRPGPGYHYTHIKGQGVIETKDLTMAKWATSGKSEPAAAKQNSSGCNQGLKQEWQNDYEPKVKVADNWVTEFNDMGIKSEEYEDRYGYEYQGKIDAQCFGEPVSLASPGMGGSIGHEGTLPPHGFSKPLTSLTMDTTHYRSFPSYDGSPDQNLSYDRSGDSSLASYDRSSEHNLASYDRSRDSSLASYDRSPEVTYDRMPLSQALTPIGESFRFCRDSYYNKPAVHTNTTEPIFN